MAGRLVDDPGLGRPGRVAGTGEWAARFGADRGATLAAVAAGLTPEGLARCAEPSQAEFASALSISKRTSNVLVWSAQRAYTRRMRCEWDEAKRQANLQKHGVDFADAAAALEDPGNRTLPDTDAQGEARWITLGLDALLRTLVVVWTERAGDRIRIISARKASRGEGRHYPRD